MNYCLNLFVYDGKDPFFLFFFPPKSFHAVMHHITWDAMHCVHNIFLKTNDVICLHLFDQYLKPITLDSHAWLYRSFFWSWNSACATTHIHTRTRVLFCSIDFIWGSFANFYVGVNVPGQPPMILPNMFLPLCKLLFSRPHTRGYSWLVLGRLIPLENPLVSP